MTPSTALRSARASIKFHGFDVRRLVKFLLLLPRLFNDLHKYVLLGGEVQEILPIYNEDAGAGCSFNDYMLLDYLVVQELRHHLPSRHLDVGSRIDGLVLQASHLCQVSCLDIRPNPRLGYFGISSITADVCTTVNVNSLDEQSFESISSVHAVEHFGLGRYGDSLNPLAIDQFINNISYLLKDEGIFYLGFPCGDNVTVFNAHRLMRPSFYIQKLGNMFRIKKAFLIDSSSSGLTPPWIEKQYIEGGGEFQFDKSGVSACLLVLTK